VLFFWEEVGTAEAPRSAENAGRRIFFSANSALVGVWAVPGVLE
jgi:hypothetical protein